ncbi:Electron transport complex protein RnfG [Mucinivorans hirudinis]|uniref:Ion-translocating oxidoreductase complex subunit G n=1 Tax=Mucinivorans hirudinis TaxID=1433126 RepID=A0A060RDX6_9BACT|nr:Electron transport complex protein RnfG [Mucinivorans hirudinis]
MESNLRNMVLVLLVITLVAAGAVGGVYMLTEQPIAAAKVAKTNNAIKEVMPTFDNDPSAEVITKEVDGEQVRIYPAKVGGELRGYAIETFSKNGFGGKIILMVGISKEGAINAVSVIEQKETPGLGDKIEKSKSNFSVQFEGKNLADYKLAVKKDGGDVDAITASTITSRAYCDAVERAYNIFKGL